MYVGGFFVDFAKMSKTSSGNCGLYPVRKGISLFEILTLFPTLNFGFLYLIRGFLHRVQRKSVFLSSLGDFLIDILKRQFFVDTN